MKSPTQDPVFKKTLKKLLTAKPKPHSEMKLLRAKAKTAKSPAKKRASSKPESA